MFGVFRNKTWGLIISVKNGTLEFAIGIAEEVTLNLTNLTSAKPANAAEITEGYIPNLSVKDSVLRSTSIAVGSKIAKPAVFTLIAGATQNLCPFI